jgi:hypothetical protein
MRHSTPTAAGSATSATRVHRLLTLQEIMCGLLGDVWILARNPQANGNSLRVHDIPPRATHATIRTCRLVNDRRRSGWLDTSLPSNKRIRKSVRTRRRPITDRSVGMAFSRHRSDHIVIAPPILSGRDAQYDELSSLAWAMHAYSFSTVAGKKQHRKARRRRSRRLGIVTKENMGS